MGGFYPSSELSSEFNFNCGFHLMGEPMECGGKSRQAILGMPKEVKMVFSGFEVGLEVQSGAALTRFATQYSRNIDLICLGVRRRATLADKHTLTTWVKRQTDLAGTP